MFPRRAKNSLQAGDTIFFAKWLILESVNNEGTAAVLKCEKEFLLLHVRIYIRNFLTVKDMQGTLRRQHNSTHNRWQRDSECFLLFTTRNRSATLDL